MNKRFPHYRTCGVTAQEYSVYGDSAAESKFFIEFIALIIRNRIYNALKDEMKKDQNL